MELSQLLMDLSDPQPSPRAMAAAREFLDDGDASRQFDRVYTWLVWQRTLQTGIRHLESVGADLDALLVSPERFGKTFHGWRAPWNLETDGPVSARRLLDIYALHRQLLTEQTIELLDAGESEFTLVSGRAYQVRYPDYTARVEFDTDVVAPSLASAGSIAAAFAGTGSKVDTVRVWRLGADVEGSVKIRSSAHGHSVSLGVDVGGYLAHRGDIFDRSEWRSLEGRRVLAAAPEDLLVMLAARVERKRRFGLVNVNDAAVIVAQEPSLDWHYVTRAARRFLLTPTLYAILDAAERLRDAELPPEWRDDLKRGSGRAGRLACAVAASDLTFSDGDKGAARLRRAWLADLAVRKLRRERQTLASRLRVRIEEKLLSQQLDRKDAGAPVAAWERAATRLRTHSGTFCEAVPETAAASSCMALRGSWRGQDSARGLLAEAARAFAHVDGVHDCDRYRFALATKEGT